MCTYVYICVIYSMYTVLINQALSDYAQIVLLHDDAVPVSPDNRALAFIVHFDIR